MRHKRLRKTKRRKPKRREEKSKEKGAHGKEDRNVLSWFISFIARRIVHSVRRINLFNLHATFEEEEEEKKPPPNFSTFFLSFFSFVEPFGCFHDNNKSAIAHGFFIFFLTGFSTKMKSFAFVGLHLSYIIICQTISQMNVRYLYSFRLNDDFNQFNHNQRTFLPLTMPSDALKHTHTPPSPAYARLISFLGAKI